MSTPDILVIVLDDVGWRDFAQLPLVNAHRIALAGTRMRRAYSMPVCSPTRYTLEFGQYGFRDNVGAANPNSKTPLERLTLARHLHEQRGYETFFTGKWHLDDDPTAPQSRGYGTVRAGHMGNFAPDEDYYTWDRVDDGVVSPSTEYNTTAITQAAMDWWSTTAGPRFAMVSYQAPHAPFQAPPAHLVTGFRHGSDDRGLYEAMLVAIDRELGRLTRTVLSGDPTLANTLVFLLADNGVPKVVVPPGGDPTKAKNSGYEGGINVPYCVTGASVPRGRESYALIHTCDLFATVAEIVGVAAPPGEAIDSTSFVPALFDPAFPGRTWIWSQRFSPNAPQAKRTRDLSIVRTARYKLITFLDRGSGQAELLFDLFADPNEEQPVPFAALPDVYNDMRTLRDAQRAQGG